MDDGENDRKAKRGKAVRSDDSGSGCQSVERQIQEQTGTGIDSSSRRLSWGVGWLLLGRARWARLREAGGQRQRSRCKPAELAVLLIGRAVGWLAWRWSAEVGSRQGGYLEVCTQVGGGSGVLSVCTYYVGQIDEVFAGS